MTATEIFDKDLYVLEVLSGVKPTGSITDRAKMLDRTFRGIGNKNNIRKVMKNHYDYMTEGYSECDLSEAVTRVISSALARAVSRPKTPNPPRKHHWIPRCLLRQFGASNGFTSRSKVVVGKADYDGSGWVKTRVLDGHFCHANNGSGGFYSDVLEYMFGVVESLYGDSVTRADNDRNLIVYATALSVIQLFRAPAAGEFQSGHISDMLPRIVDFLDGLPHLEARLVSGDDLVFVERFPTRSRAFADGSSVHYFPLARDRAIVFSSDRSVDTLPDDIADIFNDYTISKAMENGESVYGSATAINSL